MAASDVWYPFFVIDLRAVVEMGTRGSLWVAENQRAGASAAHVQAVNHLNTRLVNAGCNGHVPNICYSLAIDNSLAQLHVSWGVEEDKEGNLVFF